MAETARSVIIIPHPQSLKIVFGRNPVTNRFLDLRTHFQRHLAHLAEQQIRWGGRATNPILRLLSIFPHWQPHGNRQVVFSNGLNSNPSMVTIGGPTILIVSIGLLSGERSFPRIRRPGAARRGRWARPCSVGPSYISSCRRSRSASRPPHPRPESPIPRQSPPLRRDRSLLCKLDSPQDSVL